MKPNFILILLSIFFLTCKNPEVNLDGAYENISIENNAGIETDSIRTITLFKNGYWVTASFTKDSFINCYGGVYKIINGTVIQTVYFNLSDSSNQTKEYKYEYVNHDKKLIGYLKEKDAGYAKKSIVYSQIENSEVLKNSSLEGAWVMQPGQAGYNTGNRNLIMIFAYPSFARIIFNLQEKKLIAAYCGTYQFNDTILVEKMEYTFSDMANGSAIEWKVKKLANNKIQLFDIDSFNDEEIYDRSIYK